MAFSAFANNPPSFGNLGTSSTNGTANDVPELAEISTEAIGFHALAGEAKVRLIPQWPSDALPPPTSSLLSIANGKGLLAAAGPDSVIIASTEAVRQAFNAPGDDKTKPFEPQLTLSLGMRISQVAFSANEDFLVLSAETGGGLAIYEVSSLLQGNTQPASEVPTNGIALRALLPNPKAETAEYVAVVTVNGQLMIADLKSKQFISGSQGQVLKDNVSIASWSNKGKQIVAGLGNGHCIQMTPDGQVKAEIPAPPGLDGEQMVSSLTWLENDIFLIAHTPSTADNSGMSPTTSYHIATREKSPPNSFSFKKLPELSAPFGLPRNPAFQFVSRLRQYPPALDDVVVLISTASADVSVVSRSKMALSKDFPDEQIVNIYTATLMADDAKRASLPMTEDLVDTSPIGMAFDLSSKHKVKKPIPGEEYEESPNPLPALVILNNAGILAAWWFIYSDSIRQGTAYPGLTSAGELATKSVAHQSTPSPTKAVQSAGSVFGQSGFGKPSTAPNAFGIQQPNSGSSPFGNTNTQGSAFGAPSGLGQKASLWSNTTGTPNTSVSFGQPSIGTPGQLNVASKGSTFGAPSGLGSKSSPWTTSSTAPTAAGAAFGQTAKLGDSGQTFGATSPAASMTTKQASTPASGGFASFASTNGFAAVASPGTSLLGKPTATTPFGTQAGSTAFGQPDEAPKQSVFDKANFKLGSTFQGDGSAPKNELKPSDKPAPSLFGGNFGSALGEAAATPMNDADMSDGQDGSAAQNAEAAAPDQPQKVQPASTQLFGQPSAQSEKQSKPPEPTAAGFTFGSTAPDAKPKDTSSAPESAAAQVRASPKIKAEPQSDDALSDHDSISSLNDDEARPPEGFDAKDEQGNGKSDNAPETPLISPSSPLPPESTSKAAYAVGDSSSSSKTSDDAPLPPDFAPTKTQDMPEETQASQPDLPQDSGEENESFDHGEEDADDSGALDDEGSGVDVGQELSPSSSKTSSKATPESSFGVTRSKKAETNLFSPQTSTSLSSRPDQPNSLFSRPNKLPLFGESGQPSIPLFANQKAPDNQRSPSPVRFERDLGVMRPESSRSVTAPIDSLSRKLPVEESPKPSLSTKQVRQQQQEQSSALKGTRAPLQSQILSDDEDEQNQRILSMKVAPSGTLDKFIAHQDYVNDGAKQGISGIEKMYRDINSMVDTVGLNSRSLVAYTKYHETKSSTSGSDHKDLDRLDDWRLTDIEDLTAQEEASNTRLRERKVQDVPEKLAQVQSIRQSLTDTKRQSSEIKKTINNTQNPPPSQVNAHKPLDLTQQTLLNDLRKEFTHFQKQLADAEQKLVVLRTKLSSKADSGRSNGKARLKQPTVEAVEKTIRKMTNLVAQKSEDIDDLSSKLDDLCMGSPSNGSVLDESTPRGSRQGTPLSSSIFSRSPHGRTGKYDPRRSVNGFQQSPLRASQATSGGAPDIVDFLSPDERQAHRSRVRTRREINDVVKEVFGNSEVKVQVLD